MKRDIRSQEPEVRGQRSEVRRQRSAVGGDAPRPCYPVTPPPRHPVIFRHSVIRCAFTVLETVIALGILMVALILVTQIGYWSLTDRMRSDTRQEAIEAAANVMELARACRFEELTPE